MDFLKWFRKPRVKPLPPPPEPQRDAHDLAAVNWGVSEPGAVLQKTKPKPLKVTHAVCSVCKKTVEAFNTYSDGRVKCLPCAIRGK